MDLRQYFKRYVAITSEHGSWVFLFSPLLIGLFAGRSWGVETIFLILASLAGFLVRQPITVAVKALSGRRSKRDLPAARFWILVYGLIGLLGVYGLIRHGFAYLLVLVIPGVVVFAWHLSLVYRRAERRQMEVEIVASGVLALAAPAGYWIGKGTPDPMGWWLWALTWFQSAASIVHAYLRLKQRELDAVPDISRRVRMGSRALLYTGFNTAASLALSISGALPSWIFLPYALQFAETLWGVYHPAVDVKPTHIGFRQLGVSTLFTVLFIITWNIG